MRPSALRAALPGLILLSACARQAPVSARFPIGIYNVDDPALVPPLGRIGFDCIQTYLDDPDRLENLARAARRSGMKLLAYPFPAQGLPPARVRDWPVEAWYLQDEPDVQRTSPERLAALSAGVRAWDAVRAQAFVVGQGSAAAAYAQVGDVLMLDWYPVPHLPLDSVADHLDRARRDLPEGKPVWMVLQAFDWRDYPQRDPKKSRIGRFPDFAELRFMSYLAVLHGARGLFYFSLRKPGGRTLFDVPEQLQALERVVREMRALEPVFRSGRTAPPPFPDRPQGLETAAWRRGGRTYVVALNRTGDKLVPVPKALLSRLWRPLFERHRQVESLLHPIGRDLFLRPRQVLVLESSRWRGP